MFPDPENPAEIDADGGHETSHEGRSQEMVHLGGAGEGFHEPSPPDPPSGPIRSHRTAWRDREDFVRTAVEMGLNAQQIADLSTATPQPLRHVSQVYEYLAAHDLER